MKLLRIVGVFASLMFFAAISFRAGLWTTESRTGVELSAQIEEDHGHVDTVECGENSDCFSGICLEGDPCFDPRYKSPITVTNISSTFAGAPEKSGEGWNSFSR